MSEKKSKTPSCPSRGEPIDDCNIELTEPAKKMMKRKTKIEDMIDVKGYKALKTGIELADFTSASSIY